MWELHKFITIYTIANRNKICAELLSLKGKLVKFNTVNAGMVEGVLLGVICLSSGKAGHTKFVMDIDGVKSCYDPRHELLVWQSEN
jgi:hypothetical protein